MFPEPVSHTALLTAAARAAESRRPLPLFVDPYAERLAGAVGEELHRGMPNPEGREATLAIRTRVFDDAILASIASGATQVVLPAAGMDTRAFRLELPPHVRWFEIDHPAVLEHKARILEGVSPRVARTAVPFDLRDAGVGEVLLAAGFDPARPTAVLIEGLLMYLAPVDVGPLLATFAALVPAGSRLFADVPNRATIDPAGVLGGLVARLAASGSAWRFGTDDPKSMLANGGWTLDETLFPGHPQAWPERLPWPVPNPPPKGYPTTWLAHASRAV